jgi:YggT family protein
MLSREPRGTQIHETEEYVDDGFDQERTRRVTTMEPERPVPSDVHPHDAGFVSVHREVVDTGLAARKAGQTIWFFFGVLETLLALRFLLLAFGANPASPFFGFVLGVTDPLAAPFANLVGTPRYGNAVLELGTAVGMVIYRLVAIGLVKLVDLLLSREAV